MSVVLENRDAIATALDRTLIVEAAAGTGKTTELVGRIVRLLEHGVATIDQIVAMPHTGAQVRRLPADLTVRRRAVTRFPYHVVYWSWRRTSESSPLPTTGENRAIGKTACRN